jgi:transcriptional regulator with XRE-family HTH domain
MTQPEQLTGYRLRDYDDLIVRLRNSRNSRRISQAALGRRVFRSQPAISNYEGGTRIADGAALFDIADALGCDLALIPREDA